MKASIDFKHLTRDDNPAEFFLDKNNPNDQSFWVITDTKDPGDNAKPRFVRNVSAMLWTDVRSLAKKFNTFEEAQKAIKKNGGFIKEAINDNTGLRTFLIKDWM